MDGQWIEYGVGKDTLAIANVDERLAPRRSRNKRGA